MYILFANHVLPEGCKGVRYPNREVIELKLLALAEHLELLCIPVMIGDHLWSGEIWI